MVNKVKIKKAISLLLEGLGENLNREGLVETPDRIATMCAKILDPNKPINDSVLFKNFSSNFQNIILIKNINFSSFCEHHIMPFFGKIHVAYIPSGKIIGLSKVARIINFYSNRLSIQENLTENIANAIIKKINAKGSFVVIKALHTCMIARGVRKTESQTITITKKGVFQTVKSLQDEIFRMLQL